jgi:hypothetical protein
MPVEIRQLVVKANVKDQVGAKPAGKVSSKDSNKQSKNSLGFYEKEELINEIVMRVMEQIKSQTNL